MKTSKNYLQQPYARIVIPVDNNGFHAEILEFPGCFAQGATLDEAYENLEKAAESWIETCLAHHQEIPEPSSSLTYSGRIVLRLPRGVHKRAAQLAERDRTSLNTYLISAVSQKIGAEDLYDILTERLEQRLTQAALQAYRAYSPAPVEGRTIRPMPQIQNTADTASSKPELMGSARS